MRLHKGFGALIWCEQSLLVVNSLGMHSSRVKFDCLFFSPSRTPPPSTAAAATATSAATAAAAAVLPRCCLSKLYVSPIRPNETKITAAQAGFRHSSSPHYQHTSPHLTIWRKPYLYLLLTLDPVSRIEFNARLSNSGFKTDVLFVGG